jgi:hypothetical protein
MPMVGLNFVSAPDAKPINRGPQVLSEEQVRAQRAFAAQRASESTRSTTQPSGEPRAPTPLNSDDEDGTRGGTLHQQSANQEGQEA